LDRFAALLGVPGQTVDVCAGVMPELVQMYTSAAGFFFKFHAQPGCGDFGLALAVPRQRSPADGGNRRRMVPWEA